MWYLMETGCHCWLVQQCRTATPRHTAGQASSGTPRNPLPLLDSHNHEPRRPRLAADRTHTARGISAGVIAGAQPSARGRSIAVARTARNASGWPLWRLSGKSSGWAVLAQIQPGRTASVWPPRTVAGEPGTTAVGLLDAVYHFLVEQKVCMAQTLLASDAQDDGAVFSEAGFRRLSDLLYLVSLSSEFPKVPPTGALGVRALRAR